VATAAAAAAAPYSTARPNRPLLRIFDLFMQIDNSLTWAQIGLGIGLTLVKQLVELHGGTVRYAAQAQNKGPSLLSDCQR